MTKSADRAALDVFAEERGTLIALADLTRAGATTIPDEPAAIAARIGQNAGSVLQALRRLVKRGKVSERNGRYGVAAEKAAE